MNLANKITHYINGQELTAPRNWEELEIIIDWITQEEGVNINIAELEFVLEAKTYLQKRVLNGLDGGVGIFEGEPYTIQVGNPSSPTYTFEGYLDFTDNSIFSGNEQFTCSLKKRKGSDWLAEVADSFSFAYLADQKIITKADYIKVPYVINYIPDGTQIILLSLSLYMMTKELIENVQSLAETVADATDAATPVIGVSVGVGAGVVTASDIGNYILVALKTVARIAYVIAITAAIIKLITEIFEQLLPKKRDHLGMRFSTLFKKGCQHLGLGFQSSIPELEWVHIPRKDRKGGDDGESGFPTNEGAIYTFGDFIREMKKMFNADYRIIDGILTFERIDFFEAPGNYKIPSYFNEQQKLLDVNSFNTDEMVANYNINWQYDIQDQNTLDNQNGRVFQAITSPKTYINKDLISIKGLGEIPLPFSLGKRKEGLTQVEKVAKDLGKFVDRITGIFGRSTRFEKKILDRRGSLLLSSHFLSIGKVVAYSGGMLSGNQRELLSTRGLWERYHYINSFAEVNEVHNQYWRYKEQPVPMTLEDFGQLIDNNIITDHEGNKVILERAVYSPQKGTAILDYRINRKYTNNLKIDYVQ